MFQKMVITLLVLIMVHSTVVLNIYQTKGIKLSIVMVEEEETSHSDGTEEMGNNLEFVFSETKKLTNNANNKDLLKQRCYFSFHSIESGEFILPDNPPEV